MVNEMIVQQGRYEEMSKASEYLKVAAAQLRRAAQMRRAEIDEMRKQMDRKEVDKRTRIGELKTAEQRNRAFIDATNNDMERTRISREISKLRDAEIAVERETMQFKDNLSQQIAFGERQMNAWNQQASQLEQSASR